MNRAENSQWVFGSFRLDAAQHLLFRDGELVPLSRKAVDILLVLVEQNGQLVEKEELMRRVWPDSFVEESNLAVHISQLRKTINEQEALHRIETIPRRGYRFVGGVKLEGERPAVPVARASAPVSVPIAAASGQPAELPALSPARRFGLPWAIAVAGVVIAVGIAALGWYLWPARPGRTTTAVSSPKHSLLLGSIANNTGDPVFDTTLREAIQIELEQSPYLTLVPELRIQKSLRLMGRP